MGEIDLAMTIGRDLAEIASVVNVIDGVCVTTHCMYPSNGLVQVTVRGGVGTVVVSDDGGALGEALSAGIPIKDYNRTLSYLIKDQGLSINDGVIHTARIPLSAAPVAILHVANASQEVARWFYDHMKIKRTSMDGKTKRQASKAAHRQKYDPKFVAEILAADAAPSEAGFDNVDDMMAWLNAND